MKVSNVVTGFVVVLALAVACQEKEATFSGGTDKGGDKTPTAGEPPATSGNQDPNNPNSPGGENTPTPNQPTVGTGGPLSMDPITDKKVNSGDINPSYSEVLKVPLVTKGGEGTLSFSMTIDNNSPKASTNQAEFFYAPGFNSSGKYANEVGTRSVTVTVKDEKGQSASQSFKVQVSPIKWNVVSRSADNNETDMISDFHVFEALHPDRTYKHVGQIDGKNLNVKTCKSFDGSKTITLEADPTVAFQGKKQDAGFYDHHQTLTFKYAKSAQTANVGPRMVLVTWLNFVPDPKDTISSDIPAKNIPVFFAFARCLDGSDPQACKKAAVTDPGKKGYFFCSDYLPGGMDLNAIYCSSAKMNGVSAPGC